MRVLLVSTYELGRQPFGLASPTAWLRGAGLSVKTVDLSVQRLEENEVGGADLVAFYVPMHTATRIALHVIDRVRAINPSAHLCAYGLYAPVNADLLRQHGVTTLLGGEFEQELVDLALRLEAGAAPVDLAGRHDAAALVVSLEKLRFLVPDRSDLPPLSQYAGFIGRDGARRTVGYVEASRGCKHLCRHCPVVPVYGGHFRVVQTEVVLDDIAQQVDAGAEHITFGDPDFFNGPAHAIRIVEAMHRQHPGLSYDVTIKVEHLLKQRDLVPELRDTGCAFVTTAVESIDDDVLALLDKGHTRADFLETVELFREIGLALQPTFVPFTPWITLDGYEELLTTLADLDLVESVPPIQLAIRLLIPAGSRLLELSEVRDGIGLFDEAALTYRWSHVDRRVDELQRRVQALVEEAGEAASRRGVFDAAWKLVQRFRAPGPARKPPPLPAGQPRETIPYLTEPWYC